MRATAACLAITAALFAAVVVAPAQQVPRMADRDPLHQTRTPLVTDPEQRDETVGRGIPTDRDALGVRRVPHERLAIPEPGPRADTGWVAGEHPDRP